MKRPEKKPTHISCKDCSQNENDAYNQACDEWEKYCKWLVEDLKDYIRELNSLPSEEEIEKIIDSFLEGTRLRDGSYMEDGYNNDVAKAISKRIRGDSNDKS